MEVPTTVSEVFISENFIVSELEKVKTGLESLTIKEAQADLVTEEVKEMPKQPEAVLMDFSNTFKAGTRGFKKKAPKKVPQPDIETA
jgi:hypothetical protein